MAAHIQLPPNAREGLPDLTENWAGFGADDSDSDNADNDNSAADTDTATGWRSIWRSARGRDHLASARAFIDAVVPTTLQQLCTSCTRWPHTTRCGWLPAGQQIANRRRIPGTRRDGTIVEDAWVAEQLQYEHLLQAGVADALVGQLRRRLSEAGRYRRCADRHYGRSRRVVQAGRPMRKIVPANAPDVAPVPFILKLPVGSAGPRRVPSTTPMSRRSTCCRR